MRWRRSAALHEHDNRCEHLCRHGNPPPEGPHLQAGLRHAAERDASVTFGAERDASVTLAGIERLSVLFNVQ